MRRRAGAYASKPALEAHRVALEGAVRAGDELDETMTAWKKGRKSLERDLFFALRRLWRRFLGRRLRRRWRLRWQRSWPPLRRPLALATPRSRLHPRRRRLPRGWAYRWRIFRLRWLRFHPSLMRLRLRAARWRVRLLFTPERQLLIAVLGALLVLDQTGALDWLLDLFFGGSSGP